MMKSVVAKPSRTNTKDFAAPPWEQLLEHRYAALTIGTGGSDPIVDRQRGEQGHQDQDQRRDGRENAGGEKGDPRLVAEGGEVVHAGEAHHTPPRMSARDPVAMSTLRAFDIREQPVGEGHEFAHLLTWRARASEPSSWESL